MIITQKKPEQEVLDLLGSAKNVILSGCGQCATVCKTGGEPEIEAMKALLEANGKKVVATIYPDTGCNLLLMKKELKNIKDQVEEADAIISMSCGDGVQTIAHLVKKPVYPANNTMFLGEIERLTVFSEACKMCGDCVIGMTGGICPITQCAKSLVNGPCGGAKDGKCEVNPENPCAWIEIYNRLNEIGQLDRISEIADTKDYGKYAFPRTINLKEAANE